MKKYSKIQNFRESFLGKLDKDVVQSPWYAIEKVDGCNFSIHITKNMEIKYARRNSYLWPEEKFFDWQRTIHKYLPSFDYIRSLINETNKEYIIYGELFGEGIQNRINYIEGKDFTAFDVRVITDDSEEFLSFSEARQLFLDASLPSVLFSADRYMSLTDLIEDVSKEDRTSHIQPYELPEGFVIKPEKEIRDGLGRRIMFKYKYDSFNEKAKVKKKSVPRVYSDQFEKCMNLISQYINSNRFYSAQSKIGELEKHLYREFIKEIYTDSIADLSDAEAVEFEKLDKEETNLIKKRINNSIVNLLNSHF